MIEPAAIALTITLLLSGIACLSIARNRRRPLVRPRDPLFEASILLAYGRTASARVVLEQASRTPEVERRLADLG